MDHALPKWIKSARQSQALVETANLHTRRIYRHKNARPRRASWKILLHGYRTKHTHSPPPHLLHKQIRSLEQPNTRYTKPNSANTTTNIRSWEKISTHKQRTTTTHKRTQHRPNNHRQLHVVHKQKNPNHTITTSATPQPTSTALCAAKTTYTRATRKEVVDWLQANRKEQGHTLCYY